MSFKPTSKGQVRQFMHAIKMPFKRKHPNSAKVLVKRKAQGFNPGPPKKKSKPWLKSKKKT